MANENPVTKSENTGETANPFDPDIKPEGARDETVSPTTIRHLRAQPANECDPAEIKGSRTETGSNEVDADRFKHIKGWGIDRDPDNDPTYPMKPNRTDDEMKGHTWERPPLQKVDIELLKSTERPTPTAVFGTAMPPSGISGMIRRYAYQHSESSLARWLPLVLADRINVIEGYAEDLKNGYIPNPFAERGWKAEWEHDPGRVMRKVAAGAAVTAGLIVMAARRKNRR